MKFRPALSLASYVSLVGGARLDVLQRSLVVAIEATALSLLIAYAIAYFLARKVAPATARIVLVLFTVPFLINYIIRDVSPGPSFSAAPASSTALLHGGRPHRCPARLAALQRFCRPSRADLVLYAVHDLSAVPVDRRHRSAISRSKLRCSVHRPSRTFRTITLPLSLPGVFAAGIFGLVGCLRRKRRADHHGRRRL